MAKLISLEGATVTVPAGWTASSGYGLFSINYYLDGSSYSYSSFGIGFDFDFIGDEEPYAVENSILYLWWMPPTEGCLLNGESFSINIIDGTDVSNQSLIQWFIDNNATIEGGVWEEERTIQGKWKFNESISMGNSLWTEQTVNFTSNGAQYSSMKYTTVSEELAELYYDSTHVKNFGYITNWINEAYRDIDFGSTEQNVSEGFYTYVTSNATQVEEEIKPSIIIKNPIILIGSKAKKVVVDNVNMTIDVWTKEVPSEEMYFYLENKNILYSFSLPSANITFRDLFLNYGTIITYSSNEYYIYNSHNSIGCLNIDKYDIDNNRNIQVHIGTYSNGYYGLPGSSFNAYLNDVIIPGYAYTFTGGGSND